MRRCPPALVRTPRTAQVIDRFAATRGVEVSEASEVAERIAALYCNDTMVTPEMDL